MRRKIKNKAKDNRIFRHTAMKTNKVNVGSYVARGGIRM